MSIDKMGSRIITIPHSLAQPNLKAHAKHAAYSRTPLTLTLRLRLTLIFIRLVFNVLIANFEDTININTT